MIGTHLGPYEITAKLGEGGMGEVWRATDSQLDREVAIKVLPAAFTEDPERLARFEREAKLLAQLNHPNIAQIYGLESSGETRALVMELIEGPTLDERSQKGALSVEDCLSIARQIAEALEEAHDKGIIHRDLKPQNIKLTPDGKVKVLDFGLAKAMDPAATGAGAAPDISHSPTQTFGGTIQGMILGTAAYMSPEQASSGVADRRADIWSFGVVLYEMLTARRLFEGETVSHVLAGVLKEEADFSALPENTPPRIVRLLRRCLRKKPRERLQAIGDARVVIEEVLAGADGDEAAAASAGRGPDIRTRRVWLLWPAAVVVAAAAAGLLGYFATKSDTTPAEPLQLAIQLAAGQELPIEGANAVLSFAPDGKSLVFSAHENGRLMLFRRLLGEREARSISGTDNGAMPFFSPDGSWVGFTAGGSLMKVPVEGGRPFRLAEARGAGGATWLHDDTLISAPIYSDGLFRVPAAGGSQERLTTPDRADGELGHWWPDALPGERQVVFTAFRTPVDQSRIGVLDLETREIRWVVEGGFFGRYIATGHLLYAKGQRLYALPFDPRSATAEGPAVAVLDDLRVSPTGGYAVFTVSVDGTLAYVTESLGNPLSELVWLDRSGGATPATSERKRYGSATLSPDNRHTALTILGQSRDLWTYSFERGTLSRLTSGEDTEFDPVWSHDGRELFYVVDTPPFELHRIAVGAPDSGRPIWDEPAELDTTHPSASPDGRTILFRRSEQQTGENIYARPIDGGEPPNPVRATRSEETQPAFSPGGRWVVYQSDETGRPEIYVEAFPGPGERVQVSADGGQQPVWAKNGEIFYRHDNEMRVVATRLGERFEFDPPALLFTFPIVPGTGGDMGRTYDVTQDGKRVLAVTVPDANRPRQIEIVTDWANQLVRLAPRTSR